MRAKNNGLKCWYSMSEKSGNSLIDKSGNGNNGTIVNSPAFNIQKNGRSVLNYVAGSSQYVDCEFNSYSVQCFTACCWIKPGATQNTNADVFGMHEDDEFSKRGFACQQDGTITNKFCFSEAANGSSWSGYGNTAHQFVANVWQFMVCIQSSFTTTKQTLMYVDCLPANITASVTSRGDGVCSTANFRIGHAYATSGNTRYFTGQIGEFMLFERVLSLSEIKDIYKQSYFY